MAALLFGAADFMTPLLHAAVGNTAAWLPAAVYAGVGALGLILTPYMRKLEPDATENEYSAIRQLCVAMLGFGVLWAVLMTSSLGQHARQNGLIATLFPQVAEVQDGLMGELAAIRQDTAETRDGVAKLVTYAEEDRESPEGQLTSMGFALKDQDFRRAFDNADSKAISLFLQSNWKVKAYYAQRTLEGRALAFDREGWNTDVAALFLDHKDQIDPVICRPALTWYQDGPEGYQVGSDFFDRVAKRPEAVTFYKALCGPDLRVWLKQVQAELQTRPEEGLSTLQRENLKRERDGVAAVLARL